MTDVADPELRADRARELGSRLLTKLAEPLGRALEARAGGRVGVGQDAHREPDDHRLDPGFEQPHPRPDAEHEVDEPRAQPHRLRDEDGAVEEPGCGEWPVVQRPRVEDRDHEERGDVVDDDDREHERPQPVRETRSDQRQQAERERGVRRHRDPPAVCGRSPGVEREVDRDPDRHAAEAGYERQGEPASLAQLAEVELAARLEPDDEEEERHQPAVHPVAEIERHTGVSEADREPGRPDGRVRPAVDVHPHERDDHGQQQDRRPARLGTQKLAQRRCQVARPGSPLGELLVFFHSTTLLPRFCLFGILRRG